MLSKVCCGRRLEELDLLMVRTHIVLSLLRLTYLCSFTGASIGVRTSPEVLTLVIFKSPNALEAFLVAKKLIEEICSGKISVAQDEIDGAKSNLVFDTVSSLATMSQCVGLILPFSYFFKLS